MRGHLVLAAAAVSGALTACTGLATTNAEAPAAACEATAVPDAAALEREGAVIGEIILVRRQVFDTSLPEEDKPLFRLANRYHVLTRASTIRSQLLFAPGDEYSSQKIAESERLLRSNSYLFEAAIEPVRYADGAVDICVTTRDVWTLLPGFGLERSVGENEITAQIEEENVAGTGAALGLEYSSDVERDSFRISFSDPQVGRSRVALATNYQDASDGHTYFLAIGRPFFALDTRWAAGGQLFDDDRVRPLYDRGDTVVEFRHQRRFALVSGGWSRGLDNGWVRRWSAGVVFDDNDFGPPDDPALAGPVPRDRKLVYPFIGFELLEDRFVETENQDRIGQVEDVYLGTRLAASLGWSATGLGANREALLFDGAWSKVLGSPEATLWQLSAGVTGRHEDGKLHNAVARTRIRHYRRQSERRTLFATLTAAAGERLDLDNPMRLDGSTGLRGYPLGYQNGDSRALLTIEQRYFTDWYPLRLFRVGGAIFADIGRTWGASPVASGSLGWLADVGIGLRLGPTRTGTDKTVHIDLAFPLDGDDSIDDVQLLIELRRGL